MRSSRHRRLPLTLAVLFCGLLLAGAPSAGAFCTNQPPSIQAALSPAGGSFGGPENVQVGEPYEIGGFQVAPGVGIPTVAIDAAGEVSAAWNYSHIGNFTDTLPFTALRAPGEGFASPFPLTETTTSAGPCSGGGARPALAMDPTGDTIVAWGQEGKVEVSVRPHGGAFSAPATLDAESAGSPAVAMDREGNVMVAWVESSGKESFVYASVRTVAGSFATSTFGPQTKLSTGGDSASPAVAMSKGHAVVTWAQTVEAEQHRPQAVVWSGGSFGSPQELGAPGTGYGFISGAAQPAIDEAGEAVAVWLGSVGPAKQAVYAAALSAGGASFAPATLLSVSPECSPCVGVAMDPTGEAIAAWPAEGHMRVATRPAGGVFGLPAAVEPEAASVGPVLATDAAGDAVLAWSSTKGLLVARRIGTGPFGAAAPLPGGGVDPFLAMDASGDAALVWRSFTDLAERSPPLIEGEPRAGKLLTCQAGRWSAAHSSSYAWQRDGATIPETSAATYLAIPADVTHMLSCVETVSDESGISTATSARVKILPAAEPAGGPGGGTGGGTGGSPGAGAKPSLACTLAAAPSQKLTAVSGLSPGRPALAARARHRPRRRRPSAPALTATVTCGGSASARVRAQLTLTFHRATSNSRRPTAYTPKSRTVQVAVGPVSLTLAAGHPSRVAFVLGPATVRQIRGAGSAAATIMLLATAPSGASANASVTIKHLAISPRPRR